MPFPPAAAALLAARNNVVVATLTPAGDPHTSIMWAKPDGDDLVLSTIVGRQKERNWRADPRTSVLVLDAANPYHYVELRGRVQLTLDQGDPGLIHELGVIYTGSRWAGDDGTDHVRLVARLVIDKVVEFGH